jgi:hypothetical protein
MAAMRPLNQSVEFVINLIFFGTRLVVGEDAFRVSFA